MEDGLTLAAVSKAAAYALGQLAIGVGIVRRLARPAGGNGPGPGRVPLDAWLGRLAGVVSVLLVIALSVRLWAQTASAFGPSDAWSVESLRVIALESRWGSGWRMQMMAATALLVAALAVRGRDAAWVLFDAAAVAAIVTMPLLGHAGGSVARHVLHAAHNLGAATWLGTLGVVVLTTWRSRSGLAFDIAALTRRFSPLALAASAIVAASGAVAAWLYVGSWAALWTTAYGRLLLAKLGVVSLVVLCGWTNWRAVSGGQSPRRTVMTMEWLAALLVLGLTGLLTETEHP